jgi:pimeloyl-ACP methyl ester carboxylesterase
VHALDRDTLKTDLADLQRVDLQLIAMIDDARNRLANLGIVVDEKVLMNGFSASGSFVHRFTLLHPDRVKAMAAGSGGCPMVPVPEWNGQTLRYPVGIFDLGTLAGQPFDLGAYRKVPKYIYVGDKDDNDSVDYPDGFDEKDRELIYQIFGDPIYIYERWLIAEQIFNSANVPGQFVVYPNVGHTITNSMWEDIRHFFHQSKRGNKSLPFLFLLFED